MTNSLSAKASALAHLEGKTVVADTSSLLMAGTGLLSVLPSLKLVIPAIVVKELEEKRTHSTLGFLAREWLRLLEELRVEYGTAVSTGVQAPAHDGITLQMEPNHSTQKSLPEHLQDGSHDSTVLAVANNILHEFKAESLTGEADQVVLLSNDMPMRLAATLDLAISAYEFSPTKLLDAKPFNGRYQVNFTAAEDRELGVSALGDTGLSVGVKNAVLSKLPKDVSSSAFVELLLEGQSLARGVVVQGQDVALVPHKNKAGVVTGKTLEQNVLIDMLKRSPEELPVVSVGGGAGTGKTLLTIATALEELRLHNYERVIVFRSLHEMGQGQEMGFLPGDVNDKMSAWAGAIYDAFDAIARIAKPLKKNATAVEVEKQKAEAKKYREMVEIAPITYLRGRSLAHTFMVLEEAQNFSRSEILNILSRAGKGSKIVLTFDSAQVDNRFLKAGHDADIWSVIDSLKHEDIFAHITLTRTERSRVAEVASRILEQG
jgi:PhoH-like ATPase